MRVFIDMKKLKKGYKRVYFSIVFTSKEYGEFETNIIDGKGASFDIPIDVNCKPIHIYQYETKRLGEEVLIKQTHIK